MCCLSLFSPVTSSFFFFFLTMSLPLSQCSFLIPSALNQSDLSGICLRQTKVQYFTCVNFNFPCRVSQVREEAQILAVVFGFGLGLLLLPFFFLSFFLASSMFHSPCQLCNVSKHSQFTVAFFDQVICLDQILQRSEVQPLGNSTCQDPVSTVFSRTYVSACIPKCTLLFWSSLTQKSGLAEC